MLDKKAQELKIVKCIFSSNCWYFLLQRNNLKKKQVKTLDICLTCAKWQFKVKLLQNVIIKNDMVSAHYWAAHLKKRKTNFISFRQPLSSEMRQPREKLWRCSDMNFHIQRYNERGKINRLCKTVQDRVLQSCSTAKFVSTLQKNIKKKSVRRIRFHKMFILVSVSDRPDPKCQQWIHCHYKHNYSCVI